MNTIEYKFIRANSINLQVAMAGPQDGEPVILLHGFPDASLAGKNKYKPWRVPVFMSSHPIKEVIT